MCVYFFFFFVGVNPISVVEIIFFGIFSTKKKILKKKDIFNLTQGKNISRQQVKFPPTHYTTRPFLPFLKNTNKNIFNKICLI